MTDESEDLLARLDETCRHEHSYDADKDEAAALIRVKDAENARLVAEMAEWKRLAMAGELTARLCNITEAALAAERTARLAAEARVGDASAAWEDFKASSTSQDHYAAVARLDAALTKEAPND